MRSLFTHLFKQLVSVNQTNETVSRDYRKGVISWLSADHLLCATYNRGTTRFFRLAAMVTLLLTLACGNVWGGTPITWTASSSDVATLVGKNKVTVGSGTQTFDVWAVRAKVDASNTPAISYDGGVKLNDNAINKSGVAVYIPSGVDDIESIEFYLKTSSSRKTYYASGSSCPSSGTVTGSALATSFTAYDFWSGGTYNKNYYYAIGGKSGGSGEVYIQKIVVTFADGGDPTPSTYTVTYDGNGKTGGSVPTDSNSPYEENDEVTVLGNTGTLVKTNYTFTGWNTAADGSGTHYDADDTFTMGTSNVTLYAEWQYSFTTHSPGTYTAAVGSGGYGKTLKTVSSRDYEVYLFSASSSKGTLYAGSASSITDGKALFSGVAANAEGVASDGWLIAKASTYAGSGSTNVNEFSGSSGALTTHYAGITSAQSIKMKISGYDQFSMIGRDGSTTSGKGKFIVKVDGVSQSITATTTDNNVYRFDISTGTHIIEITADGTDNVSRFRGFSLRIPAVACVAPTSVTVSGTNKYLAGQTVSLTATPDGGTGTPSYQWQKEINSVWTNVTNGTSDDVTISGATTNNLQITNCNHNHSGQYRCVVSTGATCSTNSSAYGVHVFSIYGRYYGGEYSHNEITWTSGTTGTATIHLNAKSTYQFKVWSNDGYYYGAGNDNYIIQPASWDCGIDNTEIRLLTGPEGDYTFTVNIEHGLDGSPYVNVQVGYPSVTHPNTGYVYVQKFSWRPYLHYWYDNDHALTAWGSDPQLNSDQYTNICGTEYWYIPVIDYYCNFIAKDAAGDPSNTTGDQHTNSPHPGQRLYNNGSWNWGSFTTYTISYNANNGSGSMASHTGICPNGSQTLTANSFTCDGYSFSGWNTVANGSGTPYADEATISSINANIELFAQWTCVTPTITTNLSTSTVNYNVGDAATALSVAATAAGGTVTYQWYSNDENNTTTPTTLTGQTSASYTPSTASVGTTYYYCVATNSTAGCSTTVTSNITPVTVAEAATLTALEADVLYQAQDMANVTFTTDTWFAGLSTNHRFETYGDGSSTSAKGSTISSTNVADDISTKSFTSKLYIMTANNRDNNSDPTKGAIEFITPSTAGVLYIYLEQTNSGLTLKKKGTSTSASLSGANYKVMEVDANTHYFINGSGSNRGLYGIKYVSTYSVAITPTNVTKVTGATGATAAIPGKAYTATFTANVGYTLPSDATVTIGGTPQTKGSGYTWTISDGTATLTIPAANVTGAISITVTGVAAESYSITYHCNGAESGCPSNVAAAYTLPSPLPTGLTKDGYDFGGWFTDSECTVAAVAGAALTGNTDLYAKWTVHSASECITIAYFETTSHNNSSSKPDNAGKYIYGYTNSAKTEAYAYTITSSTGDNKGQGTGESDYLRMNYGTTVTIYADNTTTGGTPASFSNVTSVSVDFKMMKSSYYTSFDIYVGSTKIANNVSLEGAAQSAFTTFTYDNLEQLSGTVRIVNKGSGSSNFHFYVDNIVICTASMSSCTTPTLPTATLSNQTVCEGSDIAAWDATPTNASTISGKGESISYSWKKKGNDTELATTATFDLGSSAAESQAGTYVVTVTVSKAGYASASANKEVDLAVTEGTEVTSIVADKATVYPGNSVTLTATANITPDSWQWYTCTSAEGAGAAIISGAESASYTIASAGATGTYYYKAVATGDCGTAEAVYTLTVSPAAGGDCFHFESVIPASDFNASSGASLVTPTHATTLEGGTMKVGSQQVTFTKDYGLKMEGTKTVSITLESALEAGNVVIVKGTSGTKGYGITINGVNFYDADNKTFDVSYTVVADDGLEGQTALTVSKYSGNSYLQEVKITGCGESCTDPEVTASADNTTACVGTSVTFTATDAHASATYQWQKLDGTWTNISGATASIYNIASVVAGDAGKYRVIATHDCNRTSNEVTLSVPTLPNFGSTVPASVSVMQTIALSINTVEATDAVKYRWYKSADPTWDAGDVEIGTNKELIKAYDGEAIGSPSYYIFCRAQNACGITTSTAIAVNVTTYVEEDCATRGNEGDAAFSFENSGCGQGSYESTACWTMNSNSKILVYYPPTGKYFKTAKVTIASSSESKASYNWSTNGGTTYTAVSLTVNSTLTERTINLSTHGNVDAFQIGRNFDSKGSSSGTLYVSKICFEYTDACTATTVTPSTASTSYEMGGVWSNPTFTLTPAAVSGETLTYSSSNEDIASVDDDGTVTFNGEAGTVTITASYAGGAIALTEYCASQGSYTITVSCPGGAPKVVADGSTDMSGCNSSVTLHAKKQDGTAFADGTYQWFRNGEEIDGATSSSYIATQAGTYTVERTNGSGCTTPSTNSAIVTSETTEPEVERLVPFQYYHVDKTYSDQMKMRHLFAVKNSGKLDGKSFKMYVSRSGAAATDVTSSNALVVWPNGDGHVDTVMVDLNKLSGKYSENDELVFTCKAIDCSGNVSDVYKETITMRVIGATPTLALICSGSSKAGGTRKTGELTVGGDFLTGYNVADLCQQTGNTSFDANTEWGLYTDLKTQYIVTPVNGYAVFNKLNYEPFDILLLTDYPKASKSDAAKDVLDDMAALCDYRPMLSFKTHMVAKSPSKWAEKGFTTSPVVTKADGRLNLNIVCYAHPMFESLKSGDDIYQDAGNTSAPLVYTMLSGAGYESSKGMQGFELAAAENFVTIGLTHYNATIAKNSPLAGEASWSPGTEDRMLVTVAERQTNIEARFILFSLNCGAQSKLTERGEQVILACLEYLLDDDPLHVADCSFTFDNGDGNEYDASWYSSHCPLCTGTKGDGKWTTAANWGPDYQLLPGEFTSVRIKKPVEVDDTHAHVMEVRIIDEGSIDIPAGKALDVKSTIRRMDGTEIYPTEIGDIHIGSASSGNGTLIFNNDDGDTKARVDMYSTAQADIVNMSATTSTWQYIGTPHNDVASATRNYYDSWLYQYSGSGWTVIPNGGPLVPFRGYCVTHPAAPVVFDMVGTLVATTAQSIAVPAGYTVIANSWTAPIDINAITDDDMEGISDKSIYFFNTGTDAEGDNATGTEAGTYRTTPIHSASYTGDWQIPSMQGFYVSTETAGTLHLEYDRHVRPSDSRTIVSNPMYAPRRAAAESGEPNVLKIFARGSRYQDKLVVLEREDFTRGYDSGWDGEAWGGGTLSPMVYVTGEGREDAVSAIPEFEGTVVAFKAGEDNEYRFEFIYSEDAEPLYLFDTENNTYTQIMTGNAYYFTTSDKAAHSRFILTRKAPQIATGTELTSDGESAKARKLLIEDKMYILLNGMLYDATGKVVK